MKRRHVTAIYGIVAGLSVGLALAMNSSAPTVDLLAEQGEAFYPGFTDPLTAASLEVIEYDETSGTASPFKVAVKNQVWSIPSHYDYPADGEERLAQTAAAVIDLRKDVVQSDRKSDHEALGVLDPLDDTAPLVGRGTRVTLRDAAGSELAAFIVGREAEGKEGFRYVRLPEKNRTYAVKMDVELSTRFADWIETNVLDVAANDIKRITINDYSIDERTGRLSPAKVVRVDRTGTGFSDWTLVDIPEGRELDVSKISAMNRALTGLTITGVRPKPAGLTAGLSSAAGVQMDGEAQRSLRSRGFFFGNDGNLYSNEGEVLLGLNNGVRYVLRFGEVLMGSGLSVSAGSEDGEDSGAEGESTENRYLFVTAEVDESLLDGKPVEPGEPRPAPPPEDGSEETPEVTALRAAWAAFDAGQTAWQSKLDSAQAEAMRLNTRFAPWYYVISGGDFKTIRVDLEGLLKPLEGAGPDGPAPPPMLQPPGVP